ncbi:hypothetical protein STAS_23930, partial [Striga asiatica]
LFHKADSREYYLQYCTRDACPSESETTVEKNIDELEAEEGETSRVENADSVESEDNIVVDDSQCDNVGFQNKDDEDFENDTTIGGSEDVQDLNSTLDKLTVLTLKQATEESISDFTDHLDTPVQLKKDEHNVVEVVQLETENAAYIIVDSNFIDHSEIYRLEPRKQYPQYGRFQRYHFLDHLLSIYDSKDDLSIYGSEDEDEELKGEDEREEEVEDEEIGCFRNKKNYT